jgi:hypothetical protein
VTQSQDTNSEMVAGLCRAAGFDGGAEWQLPHVLHMYDIGTNTKDKLNLPCVGIRHCLSQHDIRDVLQPRPKGTCKCLIHCPRCASAWFLSIVFTYLQ